MTTYYTTRGNVCGSCDHRHRTIAAASECAGRHHSRIVRANGSNAYSDRRVVRVDGAPLDSWERRQLDDAEEVL